MTPTNRKKLVLAHSVQPSASLHEVETNRALARWLAQVVGLEYGGSYDPQLHSGRDIYLLPTQTLVGVAAARQLGVKGPEDLWGGYVDHDFICTKAISHGLLNRYAFAPEGWSSLFSERVRSVVLDGLSVFSLEDARPAAEHLLYSGPIRMKPIHACAGRGQEVIKSLDQFDAILARPDAKTLFTEGVVLEQDLIEVVTHSVGQSFIGDKVLSYCGDQYLTEDGQGEQVYGGSNLLVVQGYYEDLLALELPDDTKLAIQQAQVFDSAADEAYPGFYASRRNYDIAQGLDCNGKQRSGVLEQSWRIGGASSAEVAALQSFVNNPGLRAIRVSSVETYTDRPLPANAIEVYRGPAEHSDFLLKYVTVKSYDG
ncbi:biotin carboxylase [Pseudomonas syringae]|uniref:Biotin carboxylase n=1 Tax=Pseudomonas syringae TaxID=317 RepID=A0A0L1LYS5_PSESX|nr:biotin carboxylase [Pseudomonas syringae]